MLRPSSDASNHASDANLELGVLGCVNERVDAAADVDQNNAEVEPVVLRYRVADEAQKVDDFDGRPADEESNAYDH